MNPPPLPKPGKQQSLPRQLALGSLLAPLLVLVIYLAERAASQSAEPLPAVKLITGGVSAVLIFVGLALAIAALCFFPRHGSKGILGRSLVGLAINGLFVAFTISAFVAGFAKGIQRGVQNREAARDLRSATDDIQQSLRESYDPEKGITNLDAGRLDRLTTELDNASGKMSGDDALIMQAMKSYLAGLQKSLKHYEATVAEFTEAEVLGLETLKEKSQIEPRREIVRRFLAANAALKTAIVDSEKTIRANLVQAHVASSKIETVVRAYNSKAAPRQALTVQIRDCDRRMGDATLGALDLLEAQWGRWEYKAAANEIIFAETEPNDAYGAFLTEIDAAAEKQVKLQGLLVKLE